VIYYDQDTRWQIVNGEWIKVQRATEDPAPRPRVDPTIATPARTRPTTEPTDEQDK
jgi:hypothetical protein